ncbi:MAG: acetylxylan esterase, partial [bacterium]|nr:acetylxylan esterase [bacterium]
MAAPESDLMLSPDARAYNYRNYESVMPLPVWGELDHWQKTRKEIRRHLLLCAGLNAQTAAFKASGRVVRCFEHEGVVIENICIETLPGLYLVGNLYRPKGHKGRLPLILHPHGHAMHARTVPQEMYSVPHRAMNSALLGCAAFAYSMIGHDHDTMQLEHRSLLSGPEKGAANMLGLSMFGLQLNNSIKALDYLLSRRDIDGKRVGCTGESGGATQTYFLAAVDERVQVVAPAVMLSGHFQGGCVCENAPQLHLKYSNLQYAGLIAPRPLLLTGCTGDWTHHAREREFPSMQLLYEMYDAPERVQVFYQDEIHNYNRASREAMYAWMVRWLVHDGAPGPERIAESKVSVPATDDLLAFDAPVPPYKGAIATQKQLFSNWQALRSKPASAAEITDILPFDVPDNADILIRSQPSRSSYRQRAGGLHTI